MCRTTVPMPCIYMYICHVPMPCFSIRAMRSASLRRGGGVVCPSIICTLPISALMFAIRPKNVPQWMWVERWNGAGRLEWSVCTHMCGCNIPNKAQYWQCQVQKTIQHFNSRPCSVYSTRTCDGLAHTDTQ